MPMASSSPEIRAMAERAQRKAEEKFLADDLAGARLQARKALLLCPSLLGIHQMVEAVDVLFAAATRRLPSGVTNWYAILGEDHCADLDSAKKQFMELCRLTHPDKNSSSAAGPAFCVVKRAWDAVSFALSSTNPSISYVSSGTRQPSTLIPQPVSPSSPPPPTTNAKKRESPIEISGRLGSEHSSRGVKSACPHCHAELSTSNGCRITLLMECRACDAWIAIRPQQKMSSSPSSRPLKKHKI